MNPEISVITVCRNARKALERTRDSVREQAFLGFEWIVVDGASTDGTRELLESCTNDVCTWISEPDSGLYDAMNKGQALATGNRIWFLNAGDTFHDSHSLQLVAEAPRTVDICFGEVMFVNAEGGDLGVRSEVTPHQLPDQLEKAGFKRGMVVSHQAFIPKRDLSPAYASGKYRLSADLDWMLNILADEPSSVNLGLLARVWRDGLSMSRWKQSQFERFLILCRHFGWAPTLLRHLEIACRRVKHGRKTRFWK